MTNLARASLALSLAALLSPVTAPSTHAILVEDLGVRKGRPVHISLSTGFNGVVAAGIKSLRVDGVIMDGFCIDPFTRALSSSSGYSLVPLTQAPEAPWTLTTSEATQVSDLWAMFYSPDMKKKKAAGLQIAIWEIVGGDDFTAIGKSYGAKKMLAALGGFTGQGADLIALTGPGQDYVIPTPPGSGGESTPTPTPGPSPPPTNVPDGGSTFPLFATAILALLVLNTSCVPALVRVRVRRDQMSVKRP
jgi:VPDSG-CTERM motif